VKLESCKITYLFNIKLKAKINQPIVKIEKGVGQSLNTVGKMLACTIPRKTRHSFERVFSELEGGCKGRGRGIPGGGQDNSQSIYTTA
jgi:hypothetical protein